MRDPNQRDLAQNSAHSMQVRGSSELGDGDQELQLVQGQLQRARLQFRQAAQSLGDDIHSLQRVLRWKDAIRDHAPAVLGVAALVGFGLGVLLAYRQQHANRDGD